MLQGTLDTNSGILGHIATDLCLISDVLSPHDVLLVWQWFSLGVFESVDHVLCVFLLE